MKHLTIRGIKTQVEKANLSWGAPKPFPGKRHPVRVAWELVFVEKRPRKRIPNPEEVLAPQPAPQPALKTFKISYIGKPNRYRALEAARARRGLRNYNIYDYWFAEFDASGLIAYERVGTGVSTSFAYQAYHPQAEPGTGIAEAFAKQYYVKRIAKVPTYSYQKTLTQVQLQRYYDWYEATFNSKLRKPKPTKIPKPVEQPVEVEPRWRRVAARRNLEFQGALINGIVMNGFWVCNHPAWVPGEEFGRTLDRAHNAETVGANFTIDTNGVIVLTTTGHMNHLREEDMN